MEPLRDNPFDSGSALTSNDPFNLQTQNLSDHILVSWEYTYDNPVVDSYLLYRVNGSDLDTLYTGQETTFIDTTVEWDSTYSYYVTATINDKETSPPEIDDLIKVKRRIVVGEDEDYTTIGDALNIISDILSGIGFLVVMLFFVEVLSALRETIGGLTIDFDKGYGNYGKS